MTSTQPRVEKKVIGVGNQLTRMICGLPRTGIHAIRLCDFAIVDVAATALAAYGLSVYMGSGDLYGDFYGAAKYFAILVACGVVVHRVLGINTKLNMVVFGEV